MTITEEQYWQMYGLAVAARDLMSKVVMLEEQCNKIGGCDWGSHMTDWIYNLSREDKNSFDLALRREKIEVR